MRLTHLLLFLLCLFFYCLLLRDEMWWTRHLRVKAGFPPLGPPLLLCMVRCAVLIVTPRPTLFHKWHSSWLSYNSSRVKTRSCRRGVSKSSPAIDREGVFSASPGSKSYQIPFTFHKTQESLVRYLLVLGGGRATSPLMLSSGSPPESLTTDIPVSHRLGTETPLCPWFL